MSSGSFASSYVETVRLLDPTCHNFRTLSVRNPQNSVTKYPSFPTKYFDASPTKQCGAFTKTPWAMPAHGPISPRQPTGFQYTVTEHPSMVSEYKRPAMAAALNRLADSVSHVIWSRRR
jgi:hypothetical protein